MVSKNISKICVVGAGKWGINHIKTLYDLGSLGGVVDNDPSKLDFVKKKFSRCDIYDDLDIALMDNFDGFVVSTPPAMHYEIAKKIILKKNHVLIEKPMTLDYKSSLELCALASDMNVNLMVGHLLLFHPAFQKMKKLVESGHIGEIQYIYSNRLNLGTIRDNENVFWSLAPHDISLFNFFFEESPISILADGLDVFGNHIHDTSITTFKYKNNKMGHIFVSWLHPFKEHRFVLVGSKGMLHFEDSIDNKPIIFHDKVVDSVNGKLVAREGDIKKINYPYIKPLTNQLKYFISKLNGEKIELCSGRSGALVVKILEETSKKLNDEDIANEFI